MTTVARLALIPRDGLFCKDGRGWFTGASGRGHGLDWPWPSTILGALRTAWGREEELRGLRRLEGETWRTATSSVTLGPTLVLRRPPGALWSRAHLVWPPPADAVCFRHCAEVQRLDPVPPELPTLGRDDDAAREALWAPKLGEMGKPLPNPQWWSDQRFATWLARGALPAYDPANCFETSSRKRVQAHVSIRTDTLVAEEGVLFSHDVLETLEGEAEWAIGLEGLLPGGGVPNVATLGSDGRVIRIEPLPEELFDPPEALIGVFDGGSPGLRVVTVSPACFAGGWLPDGLERRGTQFRGRLGNLDGEVVLRAAIVPRPWHVSGWDMVSRAPKPTTRMVPPGAVFFFERADGQPFGQADARALWLEAIGARTEEGFGRVAVGIWSPRRDES